MSEKHSFAAVPVSTYEYSLGGNSHQEIRDPQAYDVVILQSAQLAVRVFDESRTN